MTVSISLACELRNQAQDRITECGKLANVNAALAAAADFDMYSHLVDRLTELNQELYG